MSTSQGGNNEVRPITLKAIAWLKLHYVETKEPGTNLGDLFSSDDIADSSIPASIIDEVTGVTSFREFVATVQKHEPLDKKVKELSQHYWYSDAYDEEAEPVTVGSLKRMLVNFDGGEWWRMLGFHLSDKEAEDVIRLMEFDGKDGDKDLDNEMVHHKITL